MIPGNNAVSTMSGIFFYPSCSTIIRVKDSEITKQGLNNHFGDSEITKQGLSNHFGDFGGTMQGLNNHFGDSEGSAQGLNDHFYVE